MYLTSEVNMCICTNNTVRAECNSTLNGTQWNMTMTESVWLCNSTEIQGRPAFRFFLKVVPNSKVKIAHVVPIIPTCQQMAMGLHHQTVNWKVQFPLIPKCKRSKRSWIDTLLGGSGTLLGVSNLVDNQITSAKLSKTGQYTSDGLLKVAKWMPSVVKSQQDSFGLWADAYDLRTEQLNLTEDAMSNIT